MLSLYRQEQEANRLSENTGVGLHTDKNYLQASKSKCNYSQKQFQKLV